MSTPPPPNEQGKPVDSNEGAPHFDNTVLDKITPRMLRAVEDAAMERSVHETAEQEGVSIHCINRLLTKVRKLLKTYSTIGAYRLLLLAGKIVLK